jgi:hypothetical protein
LETVQASLSCALGKEPAAGVIVHWPEELVVQPLGEAAPVGLQEPVTATPLAAAPEESVTVTVTEPVHVVPPLVALVARELMWSRPMLVSP